MAQSVPLPHTALFRGQASAASIPWPLLVGAAAITSIVFGLYWDISWHMTIGRDTFWTPAHLAIQFGALLAAVSCGYLVLHTTFGSDAPARDASVGLWGLRGPFGAFLAAWGGATMMISAPFDNWWHDSFGLDVQIVSPPHMVLATGIFFVGIGMLVLMAGPKNRAEGQAKVQLERLFLYIGAVLLTLYLMLSIEYTDFGGMHNARFYKAVSFGTPLLLATLARGSGLRWAATKAAIFYFVVCVIAVWVFPLFPAHAKLGPVYTNVTHMVPLQFPLLMFVPALAVDWIVQHMKDRNKLALALALGTAFLAVTMAVHWEFARFMISPWAKNWVFGTIYFPYFQAPSNYHYSYEFWSDQAGAFWPSMGIAWFAACVSSLVGLQIGDWLRRLKR
ncbi:MAG TPA: hypothetical protein VIX19_18470 [Terriglobales bacterium]